MRFSIFRKECRCEHRHVQIDAKLVELEAFLADGAQCILDMQESRKTLMAAATRANTAWGKLRKAEREGSGQTVVAADPLDGQGVNGGENSLAPDAPIQQLPARPIHPKAHLYRYRRRHR